MSLRILYVVSTLRRSGPTNQLFNIVSGMSVKRCEVYVLTLSPEPKDSMKHKFDGIPFIRLHSLNQSRVMGLLGAKKGVAHWIELVQPDVIHTQGVRADSILSSLCGPTKRKWLLTSRNYPWIDYRMKFGWLKGTILAYQHVLAQGKCENVVACSSSIKEKLVAHGISAIVIRNGSRKINLTKESGVRTESPVFITVGSLISRKNVQLLLESFARYRAEQGRGSLLVVGGGPLEAELKIIAGDAVSFTGDTEDVGAYLVQADCFVSASKSEGMPNAVLEALLTGMPAFLSNIEPHSELYEIAGSEKVRLFQTGCELVWLFKNFASLGLSFAKDISLEEELSDEKMVANYWEQYKIVAGATLGPS